ncbi:unnamed protein product [Linum tenue]|uniref:Uncharacterized protein n=1 Tax=Linum tenue TaxID=586396 RepID=A0AAV0KCV7_9ROSI|nr:unnamed protein product [Linum tenue]
MAETTPTKSHSATGR